jgi:hypothetical protein
MTEWSRRRQTAAIRRPGFGVPLFWRSPPTRILRAALSFLSFLLLFLDASSFSSFWMRPKESAFPFEKRKKNLKSWFYVLIKQNTE